jgi:hypothetical protein
MKSLLIVLAMVATLGQAHALELLAYKSTSSKTVKLDDAAVEKAWSSATPACLKDGAKIMGVNKAFKAKKLGYRDCSSSDAAVEKQKLLGYEVTVIKITELSANLARKVYGMN